MQCIYSLALQKDLSFLTFHLWIMILRLPMQLHSLATSLFIGHSEQQPSTTLVLWYRSRTLVALPPHQHDWASNLHAFTRCKLLAPHVPCHAASMHSLMTPLASHSHSTLLQHDAYLQALRQPVTLGYPIVCISAPPMAPSSCWTPLQP